MLRLEKLSDLKNIYNFQDTIILCEIFENRTPEMMKKTLYNPQKCTSVSWFSGCMHCFLSKTIIALPAHTEIVDLFEQTLIGGFSCVNTRLALDSIIFLPKHSHKQNNKNNQYGNAMTKPNGPDNEGIWSYNSGYLGPK